MKSDNDENCSEKIIQLHNYLKMTTQGYNNFKNKNFQESIQFYSKSVNIAKKISELKHAESQTNLAVSLYHLGKFPECLDMIENAYKIMETLYNDDITNSGEINFLYLRVCANITLINLTLGKTNEALKYNNQTISIIEKENNSERKVLLFKEMLMIYFHIDTTLEDYYEKLQTTQQDEEDEENSEEVGKDLKKKNKNFILNPKSKTLFLIHNFLRDSDFSGWIKLLEENISYFKENSNIPAYIFSVLNSCVFSYIQTGKMDQTKNQLSNIIKSLKINGKLKNSEKILSEWKGKIECAIEIYKDILSLEESISEKFLQIFEYFLK